MNMDDTRLSQDSTQSSDGNSTKNEQGEMVVVNGFLVPDDKATRTYQKALESINKVQQSARKDQKLRRSLKVWIICFANLRI